MPLRPPLRLRGGPLRAAVLFLPFAPFLLGASAASAHLQSYSFAWASEPSSPGYPANSSFAYNDAGGGVAIVRTGLGEYSVRFYGLQGVTQDPGNVQVSGFGSGTSSCQLTGRSGDFAEVKCFLPNGAPTDAPFSLLWVRRESHTDEIAYAHADEPTLPSYSPVDAFNPAGTVTVNRSGVGSYSVAFADFGSVGSGGGNVQVTSVGSTPARCKVLDWGSASVDVRCHDLAGNPADSAFDLLYHKPDLDREGLAFAWVDNPGAGTSTPSTPYSYNAGAGPIQVTRLGTGFHEVQWDGMESQGINGGNVQATAYGAGDDWCKVFSWGNRVARVACFDAAGVPVDALFNVFFHKTPRGLFTQSYAFGHADLRSFPTYTGSLGTSYNAAGGTVEFDHFSVGATRVTWSGMENLGRADGVVLVSAAEELDGFCRVDSWLPTEAVIACYGGLGIPADLKFNILYLRPGEGTAGVAYALADEPDKASYSPPGPLVHNPTGGAVTVNRSSPGRYSVTWSGYGATAPATGGHVQVSAYGAGTERCNPVSWSGDSVSVACNDVSGAASDSSFTVVYLRPGEKRDGIAFLWANQESVEGTYNPSSLYVYNPGNRETFIGRDGTGRYTTYFDGYESQGSSGYARFAGHRQVTAYGAAANFCNSWSATEKGAAISCLSPSGTPVDSKYAFLFLRPINVPEPGFEVGLGGGVLLLGLLQWTRSRPAANRSRIRGPDLNGYAEPFVRSARSRVRRPGRD